ncbi:MAG: hypothetical protein R6X10_14755 [Desulfobacterales bacterium]
MDFETILPFIVLGVYLLSLFGKKKNPQGKEPVQETTSLKNIFQGLAKQLKEQVDSAGKSFEQSDQKRQEPPKKDDPKTKSPEVAWGKKEETDIPQLNPLLEKQEEKRVKKTLLEKTEMERIVEKAKKKKSFSAPLPENLQQAVIWYEILAPPIALRDDNERVP